VGKTRGFVKGGAPGEITPGILPSALAGRRRYAPTFKFVPDKFVELWSFEPRRERS
jgi:hypothetical protein